MMDSRGTPALSESALSETRSPRCALPMMSPTLSSSGIISSCNGFATKLAHPLPGQFPKRLRYIKNGNGPVGFFFDRRHGDVVDAARNNPVERRLVAANVQRESVH